MSGRAHAPPQTASVFVVAVICLELADPGAAPVRAETLMNRRCPSDAADRVDPLSVGRRRLFGPHSDLTERPGMFCGLQDDRILRLIKTARIRSIRLNPAGFSLSLKLELEGPCRALFKPSQHGLRSVPRKEIVAYRLNRLMGLSRVPPATTRVVSLKQFQRKAGFARRIRHWVVSRSKITDDHLRGEVSWWIPRISHLELEKPAWQARWEEWLRWDGQLPARDWELAGQLSRLVVFDALMNNQDRFTGNNFLATPDGRRLYVMDNAVSLFPDSTARGAGLVAVLRVHRFSRMMYRALKKLTARSIVGALKVERNVAWSFLILKIELEALMARRDFLLARADELVVRYGWDRVMYFP